MNPMAGMIDFQRAFGAFTIGAGFFVMQGTGEGTIASGAVTDRRRRVASASPFIGLGFVPDWGIAQPKGTP